MNLRSVAVLFILVLAVGALAYRWGFSRGAAFVKIPPINATDSIGADQPNSSASVDELKQKLVRLSGEEYADYLRLKDARARYLKADELLGKLMLLVLTDLGIRLSPEMEASVKASAEGKGVAAESEDQSQLPLARMRKSDFDGSSATEPSLEKVGRDGSLERMEKGLEEIYSEREVEEFLKKVTVANLFDQLKSGRTLNPSQVQSLQGSFVGNVHFDDPNEKRWDVKLTFDGELRGDSIKGRAQVELSKDGKRFSNSRSSGNLATNFTSMPGTSRGIVVEANGGDGYFQLYAPPRLTNLVGLYYHKQGVGEFRRTGTVILVRQ